MPEPWNLVTLYQDLHAHPELSFAEHRTAALVARLAKQDGFEVTTGVGGTGVVATLRNGAGPHVMLRADMDGLPVREDTGLPYASTVTAPGPDGAEVPVMHACGHDVHVTCLLGALRELGAARRAWSGTVTAVFQPAEELGQGAAAMLEDGLLERCGTPHVVLGQHVVNLPSGALGAHPGPAFAGAEALLVRLHGRGGHGSMPHTTVDPVVLAAAVVMRLQTVVSREIPPADTAVITVGSVHAGSRPNIIPDLAELHLSTRAWSEPVAARLAAAVERVVHAEAAASGVPRPPEILRTAAFPVLVNDAAATARTMDAFTGAFGAGRVTDPGRINGSEDVGLLATAAGAPLVYWLLGGDDPAAPPGSGPSNHSPAFAPRPEPTLDTGVRALVTAARTWLTT